MCQIGLKEQLLFVLALFLKLHNGGVKSSSFRELVFSIGPYVWEAKCRPSPFKSYLNASCDKYDYGARVLLCSTVFSFLMVDPFCLMELLLHLTSLFLPQASKQYQYCVLIIFNSLVGMPIKVHRNPSVVFFRFQLQYIIDI